MKIVEDTWKDFPLYLDPKLQSVFGWFDYPHVYDRIINTLSNGAKFVEVGTYAGQSIIYFALRARELGKKIDITTIDLYPNINEHTRRVRENILDFEVHEVKYLIEDSGTFLCPNFDCVWIDGDHSYDRVVRDIKHWLRQAKRGSILCGHDYWMDDVKRAVQNTLGDVDVIDPPAGTLVIPEDKPYPPTPCWWYQVQ